MKKRLKTIYLSILTRLKITKKTTKKTEIRLSKRRRLHNLSKRVRAFFVISGGSGQILLPPTIPIVQIRRQACLLSDRDFYPKNNKIVVSSVEINRPVTSKISVLYKKK